MKSHFSLLTLTLLLGLIFCTSTCVGNPHKAPVPLNVTLHGITSQNSLYGWKISDWFHYFNTTSTEEIQVVADTKIDLSPLNLSTKHGIWLLANHEDHHPLTFENKDLHLNPSLEYTSSSQLYDDLEIVAYLSGNSYFNVTIGSRSVRLQNNCHKDQVSWKTLVVSLGASGKFKIEGFTPDKDDFLILDKIIASQKRPGDSDNKPVTTSSELKDMTPPCVK